MYMPGSVDSPTSRRRSGVGGRGIHESPAGEVG
jgi:hypothetical protein